MGMGGRAERAGNGGHLLSPGLWLPGPLLLSVRSRVLPAWGTCFSLGATVFPLTVERNGDVLDARGECGVRMESSLGIGGWWQSVGRPRPRPCRCCLRAQ